MSNEQVLIEKTADAILRAAKRLHNRETTKDEFQIVVDYFDIIVGYDIVNNAINLILHLADDDIDNPELRQYMNLLL